jgi:hypothetical protein
MRTAKSRRGYALLLVLVFVTLLLSLAGLAFRQIAATLRVESVRSLQTLRDSGSVIAVSRALSLLQTGPPPSNPFECGILIETSMGPKQYTVTFASEEEAQWSVTAAPTPLGSVLDPMPANFSGIE